MQKSKVNLVIDGLMFLAIAAIAGIGFLIKWVLPPGPDRLAKYGRNVELSWLGMDRHQFGTIHLYVAFALLGLLMLHIVLHWSQIVAIFRRLVPGQVSRRAVAVAFAIACAALLAFPLFVKPEISGAGGERGGVHEASMDPGRTGHRGRSRAELYVVDAAGWPAASSGSSTVTCPSGSVASKSGRS